MCQERHFLSITIKLVDSRYGTWYCKWQSSPCCYDPLRLSLCSAICSDTAQNISHFLTASDGHKSVPQRLFHPCWLVDDVPITPPAILYGPEPAPQISEEDKQQAEATTLATSVYARLNDLPATTCIVFSKKFLQMLDQGNVNPTPAIQDPPITKSRGRPPKRKKNSFNGNFGF